MANINASVYGRTFDISFDCSGAKNCKFAIWEVIPIDDDEHCAFRQYGSCRKAAAQIEAIEALKRRLSQRIKDIEHDSFFEE